MLARSSAASPNLAARVVLMSSVATPRPPRVLFMHGLESGAFGSKARWLSERFETAAPDQQVSAYNPLRRNGPMAACLAYVFSFGAAARYAGGSIGLSVAGLASAGLVPFLQWRMRVAMRRCVALMEVALRREKPDVVVGSSWGGAVALKCIEQGYWAGPAVLLAPAISARGVWNLAWPSFEPELPAAAAARVLVVQGDRDDTVPFERVVDLCRRKGLRLEVVEGGDHRLVGAMLGPTERLAQLVRDEYQSSAPSPSIS